MTPSNRAQLAWAAAEAWRHSRSEPTRDSRGTILLGATLEAAASSSIDAGPLARILAEVDDDTSKKVREAVTARLARDVCPGGIYLAAGCWLVTAKA